MPSPVNPTQFCETVPSPNADLCTRFRRFLSFIELFCQFISWLINDDGTISDEVKTEIITQALPPGSITYSLSNNMGTDWLLANGAAVSRTTYASLFGAIGTRYGSGDGSTTFNLPDIRGRSLIGAGLGDGLTNRDIATIEVGEESHVQTLAELVEHDHDYEAHKSGATGGDGGAIWNEPDPGAEETFTVQTAGFSPPSGMNVIHPCIIAFCYIKT